MDYILEIIFLVALNTILFYLFSTSNFHRPTGIKSSFILLEASLVYCLYGLFCGVILLPFRYIHEELTYKDKKGTLSVLTIVGGYLLAAFLLYKAKIAISTLILNYFPILSAAIAISILIWLIVFATIMFIRWDLEDYQPMEVQIIDFVDIADMINPF